MRCDSRRCPMRRVVWLCVLAMAILHQDYWYWDDRTLVLGFLPIGLAYHALFSLLAGATWWLAVRYAWPAEVEAWADESVPVPVSKKTVPVPVSGAGATGARP